MDLLAGPGVVAVVTTALALDEAVLAADVDEDACDARFDAAR